MATTTGKTQGMRPYPEVLAARDRLCDWEAAFMAGYRDEPMPTTDNMASTRMGYKAGVRNRERIAA